jgi:hypothetical protein
VTDRHGPGDDPGAVPPGNGSPNPEDDEKLVVALGVEAARATRRLAAHLEVSLSETIRRALTVLELFVTFAPDKRLLVWNEKTGVADQLRFDWSPHGELVAPGDVIYRPLQAWSRPRAADGVVTVHFATREHPERRFTLTAAAARELAIQLMRHSKRVRRAMGEEGEEQGHPRA